MDRRDPKALRTEGLREESPPDHEKGLNDLIKSLELFGVAEPIVINRDDTIISGHARKHGRRSGRKPKPSKVQKRKMIKTVTSGRKSGAEVARLFEIHLLTVSRLVASKDFRRLEHSYEWLWLCPCPVAGF